MRKVLIVLLIIVLVPVLIILSPLIFIILIAPLSYRVEGQAGTNTDMLAKISWFFSLVRVKCTFDGNVPNVTANVAMFRLFPRKSGKKKPKKAPKKEETKPEEKPTLSEQVEKLRSLLTNPDRKIIIALCKELVKRMLRRFKPRRFRICGIVGFDNPCTTGQFIGLYEAVAGATGLRHAVDLEGDFNQKNVQLDIHVAGRTSFGALLLPVIWFCFQEPIRRNINKMRKGKKKNE
jgi:hypothetical protein